MATAVVFVDDAVRGDLPAVCVMSGAPSSATLRYTQDLTSGLGAAWLLVFFGPVGWLILLLIAATRRRSNLTVRLPYARAALGRYRTAARRTLWCAGITGGLFVACAASSFVLPIVTRQASFAAGMAVVVVGVIATSICSLLARRMIPGVSLDASSRWVTLHRVHPDFAAACERHDAVRRSAAPTPA